MGCREIFVSAVALFLCLPASTRWIGQNIRISYGTVLAESFCVFWPSDNRRRLYLWRELRSETSSYSKWGRKVKLILKTDSQNSPRTRLKQLRVRFTFYFPAPLRVTKKSPKGVRVTNTACADCSDIQKTSNNRQQQEPSRLEIQYSIHWNRVLAGRHKNKATAEIKISRQPILKSVM